jgi:hypothetical protein
VQYDFYIKNEVEAGNSVSPLYMKGKSIPALPICLPQGSLREFCMERENIRINITKEISGAKTLKSREI